MSYDLVAHHRIKYYKSSTLKFLSNNQCMFNIICPGEGYKIIWCEKYYVINQYSVDSI